LCFLAGLFLAGCSTCAGTALAEGAPDVIADTASAAQAGTTIKANNSNKYFMLTFHFVVKKLRFKTSSKRCRVGTFLCPP